MSLLASLLLNQPALTRSKAGCRKLGQAERDIERLEIAMQGLGPRTLKQIARDAGESVDWVRQMMNAVLIPQGYARHVTTRDRDNISETLEWIQQDKPLQFQPPARMIRNGKDARNLA